MKTIVFITDWTPTCDNIGPSAHLFHLLKHRPVDYSLIIFSTNVNKIDEKAARGICCELHAEMRFVKKSLWAQFCTSEKICHVLSKFRRKPTPAKSYYVLPERTKKVITRINPDIVWIYPHSLIRVAQQLPNYRKIVTGADCASLHSSRLLRDSYTYEIMGISTLLNQIKMRINLEQRWANIPNVWLHLVGQTDKELFQVLSPSVNCQFFPHPHYSLTDKKIDLKNNQLKILISGKYDVYTYSDSNILVEEMIKTNIPKIKESFQFTFHGKGWDSLAEKLLACGYKITRAGWVDNYVQFIKDFDIQIFPISVGSGTKGKVLDGLSTGLLCIGSNYAFENIAITSGKQCLIYDTPRDIPAMLIDILEERKRYEVMAGSGRDCIRRLHDPSIIVNNIINWCNGGNYQVNTENYYYVPLK